MKPKEGRRVCVCVCVRRTGSLTGTLLIGKIDGCTYVRGRPLAMCQRFFANFFVQFNSIVVFISSRFSSKFLHRKS